MSRRLTVECPDGHREEITIGTNEYIPLCRVLVERLKLQGKDTEGAYVVKCNRRRQIIWGTGHKGNESKAAPGFRIKGATKRF